MANNYCNNCGKTGHHYHDCKNPITSLGIILFRKNNNNKYDYLMIRRKDTLGFIDFIRGKYQLNNIEYIENLINQMTNSEKQMLLENSFDQLWVRLWGEFINIQYRYEEEKARNKFNELSNGIFIDDKKFTLSELVKKSLSQWNEPEWGFPKGRRNYCEKDIECAIREFEEETGYNKNMINFITNILPFEENFIGTNNKAYKHKYYLCYTDNSKNYKPEFQKSEVSQVEWFNVDSCINKIRPYNVEKKNLIQTIDKVLNMYKLYL